MATHSVDGGDSAGRTHTVDRLEFASRAMVCLDVRFATGSASAGFQELEASGQFVDLQVLIPAGVAASWNNTQTRQTPGGVIGLNGSQNSVVATTQQSTSAGLTLSALVARLPGQRARIDGTLTVSSFTGGNTDTTSVTVPLQADFPLRTWRCVFRELEIDATFAWIFASIKNSTFGAGGQTVFVWIRIR